MRVRYTIRDGELVSVQLATLGDACERRSGHNNVNEGKRTMERQQFFWNCGPSGCCCCNNCNLAAFPSPIAPHIRVGRIDHAEDREDGPRQERDSEILGVPCWRNVPGEDWHCEYDARALARFHKLHGGDRWDKLPRHLERTVRAFFSARKTVRDRIKDRDSIDSKRHPHKWEAADKKVDAAVERREKKRKPVERARRRARKESTKRLLDAALKA